MAQTVSSSASGRMKALEAFVRIERSRRREKTSIAQTQLNANSKLLVSGQ
jgi:hypothetical protein